MSWYQIVIAAVSILVALVVWRNVKGLREARQSYAALKTMNRGKIDQPGWVKQPWQHEPGEAMKQRALMEMKIDAYTASKAGEVTRLADVKPENLP